MEMLLKNHLGNKKSHCTTMPHMWFIPALLLYSGHIPWPRLRNCSTA